MSGLETTLRRRARGPSIPPGQSQLPLTKRIATYVDSVQSLGAPASVRESRVRLARSLAGDDRMSEAVDTLTAALHDNGSPPIDVVYLELARAALLTGDQVEGVRSALMAVAHDPARWAELLPVVAIALPPYVALRLDHWIETAWLPPLLKAGPPPEVMCVAHILRAASAFSLQEFDEVLVGLRQAAALDPERAQSHWDNFVQSVRPGGMDPPLDPAETRILAFCARAYDALGDSSRAQALATRVIDSGITAEGHPEADVYLLRAQDAERADEQRAKDFLEAGRLIGWSGTPPDLERSVELLQQAAALDPDLVDVYWYLADNERMLSGLGTDDVPGGLHRALGAWERGRAFGPPHDAWPYLVEATLCDDMLTANPADANEWAYRAIRAASDAVQRAPDWTLTWAWLNRNARKLGLFAVTGLARAECRRRMGQPTLAHQMELEESIATTFDLAPDETVGEVDQYEELFGPSPWTRLVRSVMQVRSGEIDAGIARIEEETDGPMAASAHYYLAYALTLAGREGADQHMAALDEISRDKPTDISTEVSAELLDQAWCALWAGETDRAVQMVREARRVAADALFDPFQLNSIEVQATLLDGNSDRAWELAPEMRSKLWPRAAAELDDELTWVIGRLEAADNLKAAADAAEVRDYLRGGVPDMSAFAEGSPAQALLELDNALADQERSVDDRQALSTARATLARFVNAASVQVDYWPVLFALRLGDQLVPTDAAQRWEEWSLFTTLIPRWRDDLQETLGFPVMGVSVVADTGIDPRTFVVAVNGMTTHVDEVPEGSLPEAVGGLDAYTSSEPWEPAMAALRDAALADPARIFVPRTMEWLLEEWHDGGQGAEVLAAHVEGDLALRVALWQRFRSLIDRSGRLPVMHDGLADVISATISELDSKRTARDKVGLP